MRQLSLYAFIPCAVCAPPKELAFKYLIPFPMTGILVKVLSAIVEPVEIGLGTAASFLIFNKFDATPFTEQSLL